MGVSGAWLTSGAVMRLLAGKATARVAASDQPVALDAALASAARALPGFQANWVVLPARSGGRLSLWGEVPGAGVYGLYGSTVTIEPATGRVLGATDVRASGWYVKVCRCPILT